MTTVLLAEDDAAIRHLMSRILERGGHLVIESSNGAEALAICDTGVRIDLVVTDGHMPELSGPALVRALARTQPHLRVLVCSGAGGLEGLPFLAKPFSVQGLLQTVALAIAGPCLSP